MIIIIIISQRVKAAVDCGVRTGARGSAATPAAACTSTACATALVPHTEYIS